MYVGLYYNFIYIIWQKEMHHGAWHHFMKVNHRLLFVEQEGYVIDRVE